MQVLSYDSETFLSQPGCQAPPLVCGQWKLSTSESDSLPAELVHVRDPRFRSVFEWALDSPETVIAGHFVCYDMACAAAQWPELLPKIFNKYGQGLIQCSQIRETLGCIAYGIPLETRDLGLAGLLKHYTGEVLDKGADTYRTRYGQLYLVDIEDFPEEARLYALKDADSEHAVYWAQERAFRAEGILEDAARQAAYQFWFYLMRCWGIRTDPVAVETFHSSTLAASEIDRAIAVEHGLVRSDGTKDTKAAMRRMVETMQALGEEPALTDTGVDKLKALKATDPTATAFDVFEGHNSGIALDEDACLASGDTVLESYQRYSTLKAAVKRCERLYKGFDLPLQSKFNSLVETGRSSCSMGDPPKGQEHLPYSAWGFQLHNLPRKPGMRECFIPRKDYLT